jgi:hypothetical protein
MTGMFSWDDVRHAYGDECEMWSRWEREEVGPLEVHVRSMVSVVHVETSMEGVGRCACLAWEERWD